MGTQRDQELTDTGLTPISKDSNINTPAYCIQALAARQAMEDVAVALPLTSRGIIKTGLGDVERVMFTA